MGLFDKIFKKGRKLKKIENLKGSELSALFIFANLNLKNLKNGDIKNILPTDKNLKYMEFVDSTDPVNYNVQFNVENKIDDLLFDNYEAYMYIKTVEEQWIQFSKELPDQQSKEIFINYTKIFENLIFNGKFENASIRSIQKFMYEIKMNEYIKTEEYEKCAEIKEILEEI